MTKAARPITMPLLALCAGPAAWVAQLVGGFAVSSLACFPHDAPALSPPGAGEHLGLAVLNLACLALALAGLAMAFVAWRRAGPKGGARETDAMPAALGRERFLGACGMLGGVIFSIAILFDTAALLGTPACWSGLG